MNSDKIVTWSGGVDWIAFFGPNGSPGGVDLLCAGTIALRKRIGELLFVVLAALLDEHQNPAYPRAHVFLPPIGQGSDLDLLAELASATERIRGSPLTKQELAIASRRVSVTISKSLEIDSVLHALQSVPEGAFALVIAGALYRDPTIKLTPSESSRIDEDCWVPHVRSLSEKAAIVSKRKRACFLIDTGTYLPDRASNLEILQSVEHCGLIGANTENRIGSEVAKCSDRWVLLMKAGQIDEALAAIEGLPASMDQHKPVLKIQALHRAGHGDRASDLLREQIARGEQFDPDLSIKLAAILESSGNEHLARELVKGAISRIETPEWLELALALSRRLAMNDEASLIIKRLGRLLPNSLSLRDERLIAILRACEMRKPEVAIPAEAEADDLATVSLMVLRGLSVESTPDYSDLLAKVDASYHQYTHLVAVCCAVNAKARELPLEAMLLCLKSDTGEDFARVAARVAIWAIERRFLSSEGKDEQEKELWCASILQVLDYLAKRPEDARTRSDLAELLSIQVSATTGTALIAYAISKLSAMPTQEKQITKAKIWDISPEKHLRFFKQALIWIKENGPFEFGKVTLPAHVVTACPDQLFYALERTLERVESPGRPEDIEFIQKVMAIGGALAPHTRDRNGDLSMLRVGSSMMVTAGQMQRGRDYAEHALTITRGDTLRTRMAWFAFADIYHRCRNQIEALIGMGCALSCMAEVSAEQAFYERLTLVRIFRDNGLAALASMPLSQCEALLDLLQIREAMGHRLETIRIGLLLAQLEHGEQSNQSLIEELKGLISFNLRAVLLENDELLPAAVLAAQIAGLCVRFGVEARDLEDLVQQSSKRLGANSASLMKLATAEKLTAMELLSWVNKTEAARFSSDVGSDMHMLVRSARGILASDDVEAEFRAAIFAMELLADHGVSLPILLGENERQRWLPSSIEEPCLMAREIAKRGVSVTFACLDKHNRLVHATVKDGAFDVVVREEESTFSIARLEEWAKRFPFAYGTEADDNNFFYNSMQGLGFELQHSSRTVFVLDTQLQQVPVNLLYVGDELLGRVSQVAFTPSISWLSASMRTQGSPRGPSAAWISTAKEEAAYGTLEMLAERLGETLRDYGIDLLDGVEVPSQLSGCEVAIVAAHGGVAGEGRFFQVVSDELALRLTAINLARALKGSRIAILFICSGGRFDKHPTANTAVALPKELLDQGCSAVLASPWPLDARVPSHWLPAFLEAWHNGRMLIEANYEANKAVERAMGSSPSVCLAMTLYGNPLIIRG